MKFSKWMGFTLTLLGSLVVLLFGVLFLISSLEIKYTEIDLGTSSTVMELKELAARFISFKPAADDYATSPLLLYGQALVTTDADIFFSFAVGFTVIGLGMTLATFTSLFSPLSSGILFTLSFLFIAAIIIGSLFRTTLSTDAVTTDQTLGSLVLASPFMASFFGPIFQFIYFSKRKKYRTA